MKAVEESQMEGAGGLCVWRVKGFFELKEVRGRVCLYTVWGDVAAKASCQHRFHTDVSDIGLITCVFQKRDR